jgi:hypothetical protein
MKKTISRKDLKIRKKANIARAGQTFIDRKKEQAKLQCRKDNDSN